MDRKLDLTAAADRVRNAAQVLGVAAPDRLTDLDGGPAAELMTFCERHGLSLDWVYTGDLSAMLRRCDKWADIERGDLTMAQTIKAVVGNLYDEVLLAHGLTRALDSYIGDRFQNADRETAEINAQATALERIVAGLVPLCDELSRHAKA